MAFDEIQFPADISDGASGGPTFDTVVIVKASGSEQRNGRWNKARLRWDISHAIKTPAQMDVLKSFYRARQGRLRGFRFKDWTDYTFTSEALVRINATQFQLVKRYWSGDQVDIRPITKPVQGTLTLEPWGEEFVIDAGLGAWQEGPILQTPNPGDNTGVGFVIRITGLARYDYAGHTAYPEGSYDDFSTSHANLPDDVLDYSEDDTVPPFATISSDAKPYAPVFVLRSDGAGPPNRYEPSEAILFPGRTNSFIAARPADKRIWGIFNDSSYCENTGHYVVTVFDSSALDPLPEYYVDYKTGIVTFDTPLFGGVRAHGEFDVPVRFDTDQMRFTLEEWGIRSWESIPVIEVRI